MRLHTLTLNKSCRERQLLGCDGSETEMGEYRHDSESLMANVEDHERIERPTREQSRDLDRAKAEKRYAR